MLIVFGMNCGEVLPVFFLKKQFYKAENATASGSF